MTTKRDRLAYALLQMGAVEQPSKTRKYRTFTLQNVNNEPVTYYVGKAGALRRGRTVSNSVSLEHRVNDLLAKYPFPARTKKTGDTTTKKTGGER